MPSATLPATSLPASKGLSLAPTLAVYLLAPLALNGLIFSLHWDKSQASQSSLLPPGWAVGTIWMLLFLAMGLARWTAASRSPGAARWIDALAALCLIYPLYTVGLSSDRIGLAGIVVTFAFTLAAIARVRRASTTAAWLVTPVAAWLAYAGIALTQTVFRIQ